MKYLFGIMAILGVGVAILGAIRENPGGVGFTFVFTIVVLIIVYKTNQTKKKAEKKKELEQRQPPKNVSDGFGEALNVLLGGENNIVGYNKPENMGYDNSTNGENIFVVVIKDFGKIDKASLETARENGAEVLEFVTQGRRVLRLHVPKNNSTLLVMPKDEEYA